MTDLSWEDCVNAVCVKGRPLKLGDLADDWATVFSNAASVARSLHDGIEDLKKHWKGPAADDYFGKLDTIAKTIEKVESDNRGIIALLQQARDALYTAQTTMPVPDYMLDEVQGRQASLDAANNAGARAMTAMINPVAGLLLPDSFMQPLANSFVGDWGREMFGHFSAWWDDWDDKMTNQAREIFNTADQSYAQGAAITTNPIPAQSPFQGSNVPLNFNPGGGGPGAGAFGGPHPGAGDLGLNKGPDASNLDYQGPGSGIDPNADPFGDSFGDGSHLPGTGLSGAGGGGFSGAGGGGLGGAAGALGQGAGLSGASGIAGGAVAAGRAVSPPPMMPPMGGMGGAGAGKGAARSARGRTGMMGGPHGAGGHGEEDDRSSWLTEDEDVWGGSDGAPPGILR